MAEVERPSPTSLRVRCTVRAPRSRVWAAWTDPTVVRQWHVPGPDFHVCIAELDVRVGGRLRIGMQPPDRDAPYTFGGEFREVGEPSRLVYTSTWEPPEDPTAASVVTLELVEHGDETESIVTHESLPDEESRDAHIQGWSGTLDSLARFFARG